MLEVWNKLSLGLFDWLLGWLLVLPRPVALGIVALATAALITLVRIWTTNQDRLGRAAADLRRLKELRRAAKSANDRDAAARYRATQGQIGLIKLKAEGLPLLAYLLPLVLLATWAFYRLEFHPPRAGETVEITAYLPPALAQDNLIHLVPQPGLHALNGWVQPVRIVPNPQSGWDRFWATITFSEVKQPEPDAVAIWHVQGDARSEPYPLLFRWKDRTLEHELRIGQRAYSPVRNANAVEPPLIAVQLRDTRLFGIPGLGPWLPAWLVGYLLVTIPFVFLLKRVLKIY